MRSKILSICDEEGTRLEEPMAVKTEILRFYQQLLGTKFDQKWDSSNFQASSKVPNDLKVGLTQHVTAEEVRTAMFSINGDKSPGPDGFNARFYQKNWSVVGCAIKIDLMKAYDSVDWEFLFDVMTATEFPPLYIFWIKQCVTSAMFSVMINGQLEGFFKGENGLRQGDPISPYLFLLVMEGFYSILERKIVEGQFTYHPRFSILSLSHLVFADDLFLMAGANCLSIAVVKSSLDDFYHLSRALLIQSVLFSIQSYWCSLFIMPPKLLKEIEAMLRDFLWTGLELRSSGAKVSWGQVCTPKSEGGLGFRPLKLWNKASMLRHLWAICKKADTMWVKWIHSYVIKNQCFWHMNTPIDSSWTMRKLLQLRVLAQGMVKHVVGNGQNTWVWLDNWHPMGPLYKTLGEVVVFHLGQSLSAKVSSIIVNNSWHWPRPRKRITQHFMANTPSSFLPNLDKDDDVIWTPSPSGQFCMWSTLKAMRPPGVKMSWTSVVWFPGRVPKCHKSFQAEIIKLSFSVVIYYLWLERNARVFGRGVKSINMLNEAITAGVRARVCSWKDHCRTEAKKEICLRWGSFGFWFLCKD
ncbi:uncharacterized protein LOC131309397 [Rhododendron vialii]|uniref:uncharacterized protein LOC131309397 n=1 Tax=Rhododendron vialii TaxID=182163 RepID=UPI00265F0992|nr:uncharacterized protein LOC131309397 [Rhododendron vialii]